MLLGVAKLLIGLDRDSRTFYFSCSRCDLYDAGGGGTAAQAFG